MSADGTWNITVQTPMGVQTSVIELATDGATLTGTQSGNGESGPIYDGAVDGDAVSWKVDITKPLSLTVLFKGTVKGDSISGTADADMFPPSPFNGTRG